MRDEREEQEEAPAPAPAPRKDHRQPTVVADEAAWNGPVPSFLQFGFGSNLAEEYSESE